MLFNSYAFVLAFMPVFLVAFLAARRASYGNPGMRGGCMWLIVAGSLLFYVPFGWRNCVVLAASVLVNALAAWGILRRRASGAASGDAEGGQGRGARWILAAALAANVVSLLFFKFSGLFFPVAISFYTFNQISLLVDLHRGEIREVTVADYLSYILFFPKLLQGPLMGYEAFMEQLDGAISGKAAEGNFAAAAEGSMGFGFYEGLLRGLLLFSMGLFKKVIMADTFGKAVNFGFENVAGLGSLEALLVAVFYSFQLYFDFSGYCDMASAVCMMMGFELPVNFNSPYKAVNIVDFWKRWHITLTAFFTKYVYIPLGGNRRGAGRMYLNFMVVFLLSGLWHGNGWNFILWGAMHGVLFVITRALMRRKAAPQGGSGTKTVSASGTGQVSVSGDGEALARITGALKALLTFAYITAAWVFFRASSISEGAALIGRIFTGGSKPVATQLAAGFQLDELWYVIKVTPLMRFSFVWESCMWLFLVGGSAMIFFAPNALEIAKRCRIGVRSTLATVFLLLWSIVSFAGVSTFLYMNF